MVYDIKDIEQYINMDLFNWTIKEDAPDWAKEQFKEFMKELNSEDTK
ncbi:MAG: hypothetical protein ACLRQZ_02865 [Clostridia bacterium]